MVDMKKMRDAAESTMTQNARRGADMLADIDAANLELNDWEIEFIDSIETQVRKRKDLTDSQIEVLQEIWERI